MLSFMIFNTDKHEFTSIWKWISCCNDVMNHVDCVIKRDVFPQKMHPCFKIHIRGISFFVLKISVVYQEKYIIGVIAWVFRYVKDNSHSAGQEVIAVDSENIFKKYD